jgi:DNA-binding NtrC family response regulator
MAGRRGAPRPVTDRNTVRHRSCSYLRAAGAESSASDHVSIGAGDAIRLPAARANLERCDDSRSAAARQLGTSRNKLARLLKA